MESFEKLSTRERDVVDLLLEGNSNKQIARALHISERTVEFHLTNIYARLGVSSRTELILKLRESTVAEQEQFPQNSVRQNLRSLIDALRQTVSRIGKELKMENSLEARPDGSGTAMTFFDAVRACLTQYAEFNGRASRSEFWWFVLFVVLVTAMLSYLHEAAGSMFLIAVLLPLLAAGSRRLHDTGRSGWWQLFLLVPVGGIVVLRFLWAQPPVEPLTDELLAM